MNGTMVKILLCVAAISLTLYGMVYQQNRITQMRLHIPTVAKQLKTLQEENTRLQYEIDRFESPIHLMELARKPEFSHLKYPRLDQVVIIPRQESAHAQK